MDLEDEVVKKIQFGEELVNSTQKFGSLEGLSKLQRKIKQEIKFLRKILKNKSYKQEHLQCSNLTHFSALLKVLENTTDIVYINKVFMIGERKVTVDIICEEGLKWMKVVARNPRSLSQISMGDTNYGVRSILDQAADFVNCAKIHPCLFQIPKVVFIFANGVGRNLASKIESYGIQIEGDRLEDSVFEASDELENYDSEDDYSVKNEEINCTLLSTENTANISRVNLDVSAMLAYCSSVTNGSAGKYSFNVPVLAQQAEWELLRPQKVILDNFFQGKKLYCCETAQRNFVHIVYTVGGKMERQRAEEFLKRVTVLPDTASTEDAENTEVEDSLKKVQYSSDKALSVGGKIRERSLIIFTFGDRIQAITVTANEGFVRAARQQGINFVVFLHESRALTEQKELAKGTAVQHVL